MTQPEMPAQEHAPATVSSVSDENKVRTNKKMFIVGGLLLIVLVIVAMVGFAVFRVYKQAAQDPFTTTIAGALNLPAFKINDTTVSYSNYADDVRAIHQVQQFSLKQRDVEGNPSNVPTLSDQQMSDQVVQRLVQDALVEQTARKYGVSVTDDELNTYRKTVLDQKGVTSTASADSILNAMYGWNLATYQAKVMYPVLLYQKLASKVQADPEVQKQIHAFALDRTNFVLSQIHNDEDFARMAVQYGEDATASNGGDLGWFGKGDMQEDFEKAAFALQKGEMVKQPVESPYGYHIIKVDDKRVTKVKDAKTGKMADKEEIKARHILITANTEKFLEMMLKQSNFQFYLPVHNPFANK